MKTLLGLVALLVGVPLVLFGVCGVFFCADGWNREPQICRPLFGWAIIALLLGLLLCWIDWSLSRSASNSRQQRGKSSEHRVCLYCGVKTDPSWRKRCQICGKPLVPIPPPE